MTTVRTQPRLRAGDEVILRPLGPLEERAGEPVIIWDGLPS